MPTIRDLLENVHSVCITGHINPDGDCIGSTMGLYGYVKKNFPQIHTAVCLEHPLEKFSFLAGYDEIISDWPDLDPFDLVICLDSGSLDRIGKAKKYFNQAAHTVNIDHHVSNTLYADENYVNGSSSSACEEIFKFMDPQLLNRDIAIALYTGIIYDTAVFKYRCTSSQTMAIAGELMKYDIPTDEIIDGNFYAKSYDENRIFGYAVMNSHLAFDGKVIYSTISTREMQEFGVTSKELEGIVAQLRLTKDVLVAVFLYENAAGNVKVSLRSEAPFDVNEIAVQFGGGGHVRASGANINGTLDECLAKLLEAIGKKL